MNIVLIIIIFSVLLIDFIKLENKNNKLVTIYIAISIIIVAVSIIDKYDFFTKSPFEVWIEKMKIPGQKI